jgi:serine/threonine-protein kinase
MAESWLYHFWDRVPARREKARLNADESLRLEPNLPEGHLALGFSYYYGDRDYERALAEFEIAKRDLPNEAQAYLAIGAIQRRQGKWTESTANLEKAAALDPKNGSMLVNLAWNYVALRNFEAADKTVDRAIGVAPQSFPATALKAYLAAAWKGDLSVVEKQSAPIPEGLDPSGLITWGRYWVLTLQRKFPEALAVVQKFPRETLITYTTAPAPKAFLEGTIHFLEGDKPRAQIEFEKARVVSEQLLRDGPEDPARHAQHGLILAALGRKDEAIAEGKRAVEMVPESQDAFDGPRFAGLLAEIYAWTGEFDEAFRLLDHLLAVPNGLTIPMLKLEPAWDPLRKDPRFQALIHKYTAKR